MSLKNFDILCEETEINLITEGSFLSWLNNEWKLEDELKTILPYIIKKINYVVSNFYETNLPGNFKLYDNPNFTPIDIGSATPGFEVVWNLDSEYIAEDVLPLLLKNKRSPFYRLNKKFNFTGRALELDPQFVMRINANADKDMDISKEDVYVKKFSINSWDGTLYFNFTCPGVDKDISRIRIGTIAVTLQVNKYEPFAFKLLNFLKTAGKNKVANRGIAGSLRRWYIIFIWC